jgi:DNA uptake protein ComE-like DNA-binding protein
MAFLDWLASAAQGASLKAKIQNDPYYRFQSIAEIDVAVSLGIQIDANQAGVDDWLRIPGISIHQARSLTQLTDSGVQLFSIEDVAAALGMPVQRLQPIAPILKFCYYDPDSVYQVQRVNLNQATAEDLGQIPAMKPVLARAIVRNRVTNGDYKNLVDLQQRLSLPSQLTSELMHYLRFY